MGGAFETIEQLDQWRKEQHKDAGTNWDQRNVADGIYCSAFEVLTGFPVCTQCPCCCDCPAGSPYCDIRANDIDSRTTG